jgi:DNA-directed RNA polymerase beta' subunit
MQRRLVKCLEDLCQQYDMTVRNSMGEVIVRTGFMTLRKRSGDWCERTGFMAVRKSRGEVSERTV